jgi:hypothetical protein
VPVGAGAETPAPEQVPEQLSWRVPAGPTRLKVAGAVIFAILAVAGAGDPIRLVVAGLAAAVLAGYAVRDAIVPVRLSADRAGITVTTGFGGHRRLAWDEIERVRVDERRRLGLRSELLEIDTGDSLHLFSAYELGAPCAEVERALSQLRPPR